MKDEKQDLRLRTKEFALRVIKLFTSLPSSAVARTLGHQLLRSGTSVGANYREACRARSNAEFISKLGDWLKELEETSYWLELLGDSKTVKASRLALLLDETSQLTAILTSIVKKTSRPALIFHPSSFTLHPFCNERDRDPRPRSSTRSLPIRKGCPE